VTTRFDASNSECFVFTEKAGLLSAAAHDLKLRVERFEIEVERGAVKARFDASSLRVVCAMSAGREDLGALSERDRRDIEGTIARTVLDAPGHPFISFQSSAVAADGAGYRTEGVLSIRGRARNFGVAARREGDRAVVEARIHQPEFGIKPYTAMLGALKVKPDVLVRLVLPWPEGGL
jgi:YceI-like domain